MVLKLKMKKTKCFSFVFQIDNNFLLMLKYLCLLFHIKVIETLHFPESKCLSYQIWKEETPGVNQDEYKNRFFLVVTVTEQETNTNDPSALEESGSCITLI